MVSHGCGPLPWGQDYSKEKAVVSNTPDSHLSSVGKYHIAERGYSNWGINIKYTLDGKESTNNKARERYIVLHSWEQVADVEV